MLQLVTVTIRAVFIIPLGLSHLLLEGITALIMWDKTYLHGTSFDRIMGVLTSTRESTDAYHWRQKSK